MLSSTIPLYTQSFGVDACNEKHTHTHAAQREARSKRARTSHCTHPALFRSFRIYFEKIFMSAICSMWMILFHWCRSIRINVFRFANKYQLVRNKFWPFYIQIFSFCFCSGCCCCCRWYNRRPNCVCVCVWVNLFGFLYATFPFLLQIGIRQIKMVS